MKPNGRSHTLRKGRVSLESHIYHVTLPTLNRRVAFACFERAQAFKRCLRNSDAAGHTETFCFCIMPDHIHWLFKLTSNSLSQAIARVKAQYSRESSTKIWQDGFHDHVIRADESLINVARYIVANPLRANLVSKIGDYPHWDSIWLK